MSDSRGSFFRPYVELLEKRELLRFHIGHVVHQVTHAVEHVAQQVVAHAPQVVARVTTSAVHAVTQAGRAAEHAAQQVKRQLPGDLRTTLDRAGHAVAAARDIALAGVYLGEAAFAVADRATRDAITKAADALHMQRVGQGLNAALSLAELPLSVTDGLVPMTDGALRIARGALGDRLFADLYTQHPDITAVNPQHLGGEPVYYVNGMATDRSRAVGEAELISGRLHRPVFLISVLCAISSHSNAENRRENEGSEQ